MALVSNLSGLALPSRKVRALLLVSRETPAPIPLTLALAELTAIDALAGVLLTAWEKCKTSDGRVDTRDMAATIVGVIGAPLVAGATLEQLINHSTMVTALARLLTECFDEAIAGGRDINMSTAAAHVIKHMRSIQ